MDMSVKLNLSYPAVKPVSSTTDKPVEAPQADSVPAVAGSKDSDADKLKAAVQEIEKFVQSIKRNLEFSIDEGSGKVVVKVIATATGEVVRQIPSEEALKLADSLNTASNVLFDAKA
ncbi:flagellar protein FlaG [Pseudomonas sp. 6D_7.1_Bac1]|uniref:flagellar protein FlaG n=1 Tax=Pseudomonas sp. 6D_7.1_Bac1 TaxID=2971615 RepID=UPI0021C8B839|nr:flagellar protein FlaG [Pseudomonas sp. 6D_7.1_Bac1]MCU1752503.1 flagellar protein FlaG [Pseudomonas sp. 6D_7.1_Bac1]